jgi:hypothetical protein
MNGTSSSANSVRYFSVPELCLLFKSLHGTDVRIRNQAVQLLDWGAAALVIQLKSSSAQPQELGQHT